MKEFTDVVFGTFTDVAKMVRSLLSSRTTWVMAIGFIAIWVSSGKVEAFQQLLAYLGLGSIWVIKMGVQNVVGQIKNNGLEKSTIAPKALGSSTEAPKPVGASIPTPFFEPITNVVLPHPGFDFKKFNEEVASEVERLMKESTEKSQEMVKWEAIKTVGDRYRVDNINDLVVYSELRLQSAYDFFREVAGFDYDKAYQFDPKTGKTPLETLKPGCPYKLLNIAALENGFYDEMVMLEKEMNLHNGVLSLAQSQFFNSWQAAFPDALRSFFYVRQNIIEVLETRGIK